MKMKCLTLICALCVGLSLTNSARAVEYDPAAIAADTLIGRPLCFVATVVGSAVFVISLPVAAMSNSIDSAANALVVKPAWATFQRPLGDFSYAEEYATKWPGKQEPRKATRMVKRAKTAKKA